MNGGSGDSMLFAKRVGWGTIEVKQLPTLADYQSLADFNSIADMSRVQNRVVIQGGTPDFRNQYLIGVYNSASRLNESSEFELLVEGLRDHPQGPSQCSFHGRCMLIPYTYHCLCDPGFSGVECEAEEKKLLSNAEYVGTLLPGQSIYFRLFTPSYNTLSRTFEVHFKVLGDPVEGAHPVVALSKLGIPRISSDSLPGSGKLNFTGEVTWHLNILPSDHEELVFGIFNVDFYVHSSFQYGFEVRAKQQGLSFGLFVRFILGITLSLTFCLLGLLCSVLIRHYLSNPQSQSTQEDPPESPPPVLESFQHVRHTANQNEETNSSPQSSMDACCTICFSEFAEDEWLVLCHVDIDFTRHASLNGSKGVALVLLVEAPLKQPQIDKFLIAFSCKSCFFQIQMCVYISPIVLFQLYFILLFLYRTNDSIEGFAVNKGILR